MLHELRYINTLTLNGTLVVVDDDNNTNVDGTSTCMRTSTRTRTKQKYHIEWWFQFLAISFNLFNLFACSRICSNKRCVHFFQYSWLYERVCVSSTPISWSTFSSSPSPLSPPSPLPSPSLYTFYTRTLNNVSLLCSFFFISTCR